MISPLPRLNPSTPFVATQESLIGKRICHKWKQPDGTERFYYGQVLSLVPGTTDWFNVIHDGEDTILSLNLFVDIEKGDLNFIEWYFLCYHQYGRYWYIGMARVLHMRNTNMHGKNSAKTERLAVKACYYYY